MYRKNETPKTSIRKNTSVQGETIEMKIERIVNNKEPITDGAPPIYTERKDGVQPAYDIRTDRFELAVEGMDYVNREKKAKRDEKATMKVVKDGEGDTGGESTQGQAGGTDGAQTT